MNRIVLLLSKGQHEMTKPEGLVFGFFGGGSFILKKFFSGRSLFKRTPLEKQRGAEIVRGIAKT